MRHLPRWRIVFEEGAINRVDLAEALHVTDVEMNQKHMLHQPAVLLQPPCKHTQLNQGFLHVSLGKFAAELLRNHPFPPQAQSGINAHDVHENTVFKNTALGQC